MAVPASASAMVWLVVKVEPLAVTVTVEVPAASAMVAGLALTVSIGAPSSSVMVTVCCVPMVTLLCEAVISTVSASSSSRSSTAVTVAVTDISPASSVSDSALML